MKNKIPRAAQLANDAARGMKIYRARLPDDDGWEFIVASSKAEAQRKMGTRDVYAPLPSEVYNIAVKALMGVR